jgi:chondroitin sulfate synthase
MTTASFLNSRAVSAYNTFIKYLPEELGVSFFVSQDADLSGLNLPQEFINCCIVRLPGVDDSYPPQKKSFLMLRYMWKHKIKNYDWFMRLDDDAYVRHEMLLPILYSLNTSEPHVLGE